MTKFKLHCPHCGKHVPSSHIASEMGKLNKPTSGEMRRRARIRWDKEKVEHTKI